MVYMLECTDSTIFNWSEGLLLSPKYQLTKCQQGKMKHFGYGVVVLSLFLERVPLNRLELEDPWVFRWVKAMAHHGGGGGPTMTYGSIYFRWLRGQLLIVENYAYAGTDFKGDPNLLFPKDDQ